MEIRIVKSIRPRKYDARKLLLMIGVFIIASVRPIDLFAQSVFEYEGVSYRVINDPDGATTYGTVAVTGKMYGFYEGTITIPNAFKQSNSAYADSYKVVAVDDYAFKSCLGLVEVSLPLSVKTIGTEAFSNCPRLKRVTIPDGNISELGPSVFANSGIDTIIIPKGIMEIPSMAFQECRELKQVVLPQTITKIGANAFYRCQSLKSIELPNKLRVIDIGAFAASGLKNITLPDKVATIPMQAFGLCFDLEEVTLSPYTVAIESMAFSYCWHLSKINHPETLTMIDDNAFFGCLEVPDDYQYQGALSGSNYREHIESEVNRMKPVYWK